MVFSKICFLFKCFIWSSQTFVEAVRICMFSRLLLLLLIGSLWWTSFSYSMNWGWSGFADICWRFRSSELQSSFIISRFNWNCLMSLSCSWGVPCRGRIFFRPLPGVMHSLKYTIPILTFYLRNFPRIIEWFYQFSTMFSNCIVTLTSRWCLQSRHWGVCRFIRAPSTSS